MEPVFPCLADEIADPRLDMNIKVDAFTVSEQSISSVPYLAQMSTCAQVNYCDRPVSVLKRLQLCVVNFKKLLL